MYVVRKGWYGLFLQCYRYRERTQRPYNPIRKNKDVKGKDKERYEERECVGELIRTANDMKN